MNLNAKIELKNIDFNKIKAVFKRKETLIGIGIAVFIVGIVIVGNILFGSYKEATDKRDVIKTRYERILAGDTDAVSLQQKIDVANSETESSLVRISEITPKEVGDLLIQIQKDTGVSWADTGRTINVKEDIKEAPDLKAVIVTVSKFSATYSEIKGFIDYIDNFYREVSIDVLNFSKDKLTGNMTGNMTLTFYMKK